MNPLTETERKLAADGYRFIKGHFIVKKNKYLIKIKCGKIWRKHSCWPSIEAAEAEMIRLINEENCLYAIYQ